MFDERRYDSETACSTIIYTVVYTVLDFLSLVILRSKIWQNGPVYGDFMIIKVYCSQSEKQEIEKGALEAGYSSTSRYLKDKAFADYHSRAMFVELVSCMVRLAETDKLPSTIRDDLFEIAQAVLDGQSVEESRALIAEVCSLATKSD